MKSSSRHIVLACTFLLAFAIPDINKAMADIALKDKFMPPALKIPPANKLTPERIALGKMLFFDPRLSGSNWISCATCHNPVLGWSDGLPKAIGANQVQLERATPTLINVAYNRIQMWDGRFRNLEQQALGPIENPNEMDQDPDELVTELKAVDVYVKLFFEAYPGQGINKTTIAKALASFERTLISKQTPFDRWLSGEDGAISDPAKKGFALFNGKARCNKCHMGFNFVDDGFHNIGLKRNHDDGRFAVRPVRISKGAFKTPTLRNVAKTGPYMHNGIYATLEEVIDHYDRGGDINEKLSPNIQPLNLTDAEKHSLLEFLKSLTEESMNFVYPDIPYQFTHAKM